MLPNKKWIVFAPSQSKVVIKHKGKYYFYKHRQELTASEPFFKKYKRIFKEVKGKGTLIEKLPEVTEEFVFPVSPVKLDEMPEVELSPEIVQDAVAAGVATIVEEEIAIEAEVKESVGETIENIEVKSERQVIIDAIKLLNPDDEAHFTTSGKPDARVLSEKCDFRVSAKLRDEIWSEIK